MTTVLISMASGLAINVITWLSGKLGLSKTYVSVGLCFLIGIILYTGQILINKYPMQWEQIIAFAGGSYAMSQMVYSLFKKWGISLK